jgi:hypothetical protein
MKSSCSPAPWAVEGVRVFPGVHTQPAAWTSVKEQKSCDPRRSSAKEGGAQCAGEGRREERPWMELGWGGFCAMNRGKRG